MPCMPLTLLTVRFGFQRGIDRSLGGSTVAEDSGSVERPEMAGTSSLWSWVLRRLETGLRPESASCAGRLAI